MKKFSLIFAGVVMAFLMVACSTPSPKEAIMKDTDEFFTQAEQEVQAITNADDFVNFFAEFEERRENFANELFEKYPTDSEGNIKGLTEADTEELNNYMYDRATAYNKIEAEKCGEFLTPYMDEFESTANRIYSLYLAVGVLTDDLHDELQQSYDGVAKFLEVDNIPTELVDRYGTIMEKVSEMLGTVEEDEE